MDYPVQSAERGACHGSSSISMDSFLLFNSPIYAPCTESMFQEPGWHNDSPASDHILNFNCLCSSSSCTVDFIEQNSCLFPVSDSGPISNFARSDSIDPFPFDGDEDKQKKIHEIGSTFVPRVIEKLLAEKMLMVLSLFREFLEGGVLAQIWLPIRQSNYYILSTIDQPYFHDHTLAGYREVSKAFIFSTEGKPGTYLGLPGRVYLSKMPEWTSNVVYYNESEYLRVNHAVRHHVHGSVALPVFDSSDVSCCAVLELVTTKEKLDFSKEIEKLGNALEIADLRTCYGPPSHQKCSTHNQKMALAEIHDILQSVCRAHKLPLALTWIPCTYSEESNAAKRVLGHGGHVGSGDKYILCIEGSACFVHDRELEGFVHVCAERSLDKMQGIIGRVLHSNHPLFSTDIKCYDISEYPVVHHARRFGLASVLAIRLRSVWTGDDDYISEFFLPVNLVESSEQRVLLNNVLSTVNSICKIRSIVLYGKSSNANGPAIVVSHTSNTSELRKSPSVGKSGILVRKLPKRKRLVEKDVNLGVLQKYFRGSLKDAAKSIGVCPTTLKRICRKHGITRWPSRKINKVNSSLRKIQTVLDSVEGAEGLEFDSSTGQLMSTCKQVLFAARSEQDKPDRVVDTEYCGMATCCNARTYSLMTEREGSSSSQSQRSIEQCGPKITIKATYKEDTIRFKFVLSAGCGKLYEEVGRRFKLEVGGFRLKYLDDEEEWVIMVSDADLEECAEVLANVGTTSVRFLVRELC